jgi:hypothetical protein
MQIKNSIIFGFMMLCCLGSGSAIAQNAQDSFPMAWIGEWTGELIIYNGAGEQQRTQMNLNILPIDTSDNYTWEIIYGGGADQRPYELVAVDAKKGHYQVDEKNSIVLDLYHFAGKLYSRFEVMGNLLLVTYEKLGDEIIFEVVTGKEDAPVMTGGEKIEGNEIPQVASYPIAVRQIARLTKKY